MSNKKPYNGGSTSLSDFKQLALLGEGAYSAVYKVCRLADGEIYALKKVKLPSLSDKEKQNALNEVRLLASVRQENIIGYKEAFFDDKTRCLCIVMEYSDGGDLFQQIVRCQKERTHLRESDVWNFLHGMCKGLKALHDMKILHRDLKCANVFLSATENAAKLGDFNVSKVAKRGLCMTQTGTPYYASPEVWRDMPYDAKSDMWSLGCVLYEMVALRPPFRAEDMEGLYRKVLRGQYPRIPQHYSNDLAEVIAMLLQVNPRHRPTVDQLLTTPVLQRNVKPTHGDTASEAGGRCSDLLQTIKLPKNSIDLSICLPKPRYHDDSASIIEPHGRRRGESSHDHDAIGDVHPIPEQSRRGPSRGAVPRVPSRSGASVPRRQPAIQQNSRAGTPGGMRRVEAGAGGRGDPRSNDHHTQDREYLEAHVSHPHGRGEEGQSHLPQDDRDHRDARDARDHSRDQHPGPQVVPDALDAYLHQQHQQHRPPSMRVAPREPHRVRDHRGDRDREDHGVSHATPDPHGAGLPERRQESRRPPAPGQQHRGASGHRDERSAAAVYLHEHQRISPDPALARYGEERGPEGSRASPAPSSAAQRNGPIYGGAGLPRPARQERRPMAHYARQQMGLVAAPSPGPKPSGGGSGLRLPRIFSKVG